MVALALYLMGEEEGQQQREIGLGFSFVNKSSSFSTR